MHIYAHPTDRIAKVKQAVLQALGTTTSSKNKNNNETQHDNNNKNKMKKNKNKPYIRLIAAGRLLAPDTATVSDFSLHTGQVVHAVIAPTQGAQAAAAAGRSTRSGAGIDAAGNAVRRVHNNNNNDDSDDDDDDHDNNDVESGGTSRLGFDRLRTSAGFRRAEVAAIRAYFSRSVDRWMEQNPAAAEQAAAGETDLVRRRLLQEDAWMQAQGPTSEFRINLGVTTSQATRAATEMALWRSGGMSASVGTDRDFVWGFMLGFFVGFLMLLWVWMPTVPHKQKLGILTGISVQLAFGLWQGSDPDATDDLVLGDY